MPFINNLNQILNLEKSCALRFVNYSLETILTIDIKYEYLAA